MKKFISLILISGFLSSNSINLTAELPEPYRSINDLPFDPHGWFGNADQLAACFKERPISNVIEVGAWLGCSTRFLASSVVKGGKVYAVDTWLGSPQEDVHMQDPRLPYLYQLFLSNVKHAQLSHIIIPVRMDSLEAAKALNVKADLIYIDGAHDTESVFQDIVSWYPHLKPNGIMCGDDWGWPTVQTAVIQAAQLLNKSVSPSGNFWRFY